MMNEHEKSDRPVVPNPSNKKKDYWSFFAEMNELWHRHAQGRGLAKENGQDGNDLVCHDDSRNAVPAQADPAQHPQETLCSRPRLPSTPSPASTTPRAGCPEALERIRQAASKDRKLRFTCLWHHVYAINSLRQAYFELKKQSAPGVDGQTWRDYGKQLEDNLQNLSNRLANGRYKAPPVRRVYIPKPGGKQRPIGVPAVEDKIVQRATVWVLNAVYEQDFVGFSYGFRPGKSAHLALDALAVGIQGKKVNWVLDADIRSFFDKLDHDCLMKFIQHRIADDRVVGFEHEQDARKFLDELKERFRQFGLELHDDKTRILRFGRFASKDRRRNRDGRGGPNAPQPTTFNFLGFTHACGKTRWGRFVVLRRTMAKRMRAKLRSLKEELRRRMHQTLHATGRWLRSVLAGHVRYFGVPRNSQALWAFRTHLIRLWKQALGRRSQKGRVTWQRMARIANTWLAYPRISHPYPESRLCVNIQGKSPVR